MISLLALTVLSGCKTSDTPQRTIEIPTLRIEVERPVLEQIPELDVSEMTDGQIEAITAVLAVYNRNMGKLVIYAQSLESAYKVKLEYLNNVLTIITSSY